MKNKKNLILLLMLASISVFGFSACKAPEDASNQDSQSPTETPDTNKKPDKQEISFVPSENETEKSILNFLKIGTLPVGQTMYVWGGGWNEEDTAAGTEAVTLGISPAWQAFASQQKPSYNYNDTRYQIHDGLDCSGYMGWAIYNILETENGKEGYVFPAAKMAQTFAEKGLGEYIPVENISNWQAGDIMSMSGHVWIVIGTCGDGSVLMLHSSPPGVMFSGTNLPDGTKSQAVALAEQIMSQHYPQWYEKYPDCSRSYSFLTNSSMMRWNREVLSDNENLCAMSAEQVVDAIFNK